MAALPALKPRLQALAAITRQMVAVMREVFPVQGKSWTKAGESEATALRPFLELLPRFAMCWWQPNKNAWSTLEATPDDPPAVAELIRLWNEVFSHYQWVHPGVWPGGSLNRMRTRWVWPDVPPVPQRLLDGLETAARQLMAPKPEANVDDNADHGHDPIEPPIAAWRTVSEAATVAGCNTGVITRAVDSGELKSNEKSGRERRVCAVDLTRWILARAPRSDKKESDAAVERQMKKAEGDRPRSNR